MRNLLLFVFAVFFCKESNAQITSVDTACPGSPTTFTGPAGAISYTWLADTVDFNQTPTTFTQTNFSSIYFGCYLTVNYDNGTWYTFITNVANGKLTRITFNGSPNGSFTDTFVGTYGGVSLTGGMGLDVVKDTATGNWYGFLINGTTLYRLDFGTSLANSPASTSFALGSLLNWPHQLSIAKFGTQWIGFIGNKNSTIVRLDFGTTLTSTPTATAIPNVGIPSTSVPVYEPCNFALHQEGGNWYMLITNYGGNSMTRYSFGTNIQNNNPTGTYLGLIGNSLSRPRTIMLFEDKSRLIGYVINETTNIQTLDFHGSILNTPTLIASMNPAMANKIAMVPYFTDSSMYMSLMTDNNPRLLRSKWLTLPAFDSTTYYSNAMSYAFKMTGVNNISLYTNMGNFMGTGKVFSKNVYVVSVDKTISEAGGSLTANDATGPYQWIDCTNKQPINGATSKTFTPGVSGFYAVVISKNGCTDTSICKSISVNVHDVARVLTAVYPNPTTGDIQVQLDRSYNHVELKIMSAMGQLVSVKEYEHTQLIHTSIDDANGLYYLQVVIDGKPTTHAVITKQ